MADDDFFLPSWISKHDDLPQEEYSTPMLMTNEQNEQLVENNIPNGSNGGMPLIEENNSPKPVLPGESGEGLPYAPSNWPNPGDNWMWKVGRRITAGGYFQDRFLIVPKHLQKTTNAKLFASKSAVANYLRLQFPDADPIAFFASFIWKIPAKIENQIEAASLPLGDTTPQDETKEVKETEQKKSGRYSQRERKQFSGVSLFSSETRSEEERKKTGRQKRKLSTATPSASGQKTKRQNRATPSSGSKGATRRTSRRSGPLADNDVGANNELLPKQELIGDVIPEGFDNYLSSLDDILSQPLSEASGSYSATIESLFAEDELAEARTKLSSLLVMDFPSLIKSKNFSELTTLASKLQKDPNLSAEQLVKLKLIEEIPLFSEVFVESREMIEQVDRFFSILESNKAKVNSLKNEYNELKEKADQLQTQVDSSLLAVQEIDNEIEQLQFKRAELITAIECNKVAKVEVNVAQKMVANEIPTVVHEIQHSNARIAEWDLKKTNALKREAEILAKFAPLKGFSL